LCLQAALWQESPRAWKRIVALHLSLCSFYFNYNCFFVFFALVFGVEKGFVHKSASCDVPPLGVPVYLSSLPDAVGHPVEFVTMERLAQDDELVYRVTSGSAPTLLSTRALAGKKSLSFEGLRAGAYVLALVDSGATHSFVPEQPTQETDV
jgi:hypothetical protein